MKRALERIFRYLSFAGFCAIIIYPLAFILLYSFSGNKELLDNLAQSGSKSDEFSLEAYKVILYSFRFQSSMAFSLLYAVSITVLQYIFGLTGGFVLAKFKFRFKGILYYIYLLCMIIPFNVVVLPQYMLLKDLGLYDTVWAVILPGGFGAMGVFFYRQFIKQVPNEILEAAQVEGANPLKLLTKILVPMLKDCTYAYMIICFCTNWNAMDPAIAYIHTANIQPISTVLKEAFVNAPSALFAPAVLYMIPPVLIYIFYSDELIRGLSFKPFTLKGASHEE